MTEQKLEADLWAWCFSHGRQHRFLKGSEPWCTALWIPLSGTTEAEALQTKDDVYGEVQFAHDLPPDIYLEVIQTNRAWGKG